MADQQAPPAGPDLSKGVPLSEFAGDDAARPCRRRGGAAGAVGPEIFAIGAHCTPLSRAARRRARRRREHPLPVASRLLRSAHRRSRPRAGAQPARGLEGRAAKDDRIFVREKREQPKPQQSQGSRVEAPGRIVIVGGGAAGFAAAEMLRRQGYRGSIVMLSSDAAPPVDRPNLSKDYLAGSAPEDWMPLRPDDFYAEAKIDLRLKTEVTVDRHQCAPCRDSPAARPSPTTGCCWRPAPSRCGCRSRAPTSRMSTCCARSPIAARSSRGRRRAPRGRDRRELHRARGRGLAARPRHRGACRGLEKRPMERVLGPEMGDFVRALHEEHGVIFHLGDTVTRSTASARR